MFSFELVNVRINWFYVFFLKNFIYLVLGLELDNMFFMDFFFFILNIIKEKK